MNMITVVSAPAGKPASLLEVENDLDALQRLVSGPNQERGYLECLSCVSFDGMTCDAFLNEEGLMLRLPRNRFLVVGNGAGTFVVGDFFLAVSDDDGNLISFPSKEAARWVELLNMQLPMDGAE